MTAISFAIPGLRLVNALNERTFWAVKANRAKKQKKAVAVAAPGSLRGTSRGYEWISPPSPPLVVSLTRVYPPRGKEMDTDGLAASFKAVRDAVAELLGVDDNPRSGVTWTYHQVRGSAWSVVIDVDSVSPADAAAEGVLP